MNLINNSAEKISFNERGKKIEYCGRVCYKSDSNINDTSYIKFISNIVKSGHYSVLEHERVIVKFDLKTGANPLFTISQKNHMKHFSISNDNEEGIIYISGNVRAWLEATSDPEVIYDNGVYKILKELYPYIFTREDLKTSFEAEVYLENGDKAKVEKEIVQGAELVSEDDIKDKEFYKYHDSKTFKIICSRACSHQIVRHRVFSFSQQSQRYCNFSNDKFGHSVNFIMPDFTDRKEFDDNKKKKLENAFELNFRAAEENYFSLIKDSILPEDARSVLPNAAATEIIMTGTTAEWESFFNLRCDEHAQAEIRKIAYDIKEKLNT